MRLTWEWSWEPVTLGLLAISATLYALGARHMRPRNAIAFFGGLLTLFIALISPLDHLSEEFFSAHMVQHELLIIIAAPLLVLGRPLIAFLWAVPAKWRSKIGHLATAPAVAKSWRFITGPFVVTIAHAVALWIWHLPSWYDAALRSEFIHGLEHSSFLFTAALFWWTLIHGRYGRMGYGIAVVYVFVTAAHTGALGALIAMSPNVIYPMYPSLEDQQLAGIIMWIPAGVLMTTVAVALFAAWLGEAERRVALTQSEMLRKAKP
jgi:cytochrome c oxidase assembly factor CtaG